MKRFLMTISKAIKKQKLRTIALFLLMTMLFEIMAPTVSYALTSGPSQPEITQFQPVGVTDMVDVFTGDFGYNIPLLELPGPNGGYPFNLSYQSGTTMDQEASWVGLGWNVNAGAIVRNMRSLPDEFNGKDDAIVRHMDRKKNETYGAGLAVSLKFAGADFKKLEKSAVKLSMGFKVYNNTYNGIGYGIDLGTSFAQNQQDKLNAGVGINFSLDSQEGVGANANATLSSKQNAPEKCQNCSYKSDNKQLSLGIGFHSTGGLNGSLSGSVTKHKLENGNDGNVSKGSGNTINGSSPISFAMPSFTPSMGFEMKSMNFSTSLSIGGAINATYTYFNVNGFYSLSKLAKTQETLPAYGYLYLQNQAEENAMVDFNREKDGAVYKTSTNLASPSLTYDYYLINGQGTGGMFRPYRQDFGHVHEQERTSTGAGGSWGFDAGIPGHYGISGSFNYSKSRTGDWKKNNDARPFFNFRPKGYSENGSVDPRYEGVYFKLAGEGAAVDTDELDNIGKDGPVNLVRGEGHSLDATLNRYNTDAVNATATLNSVNATIALAHAKMRRERRTPRATTIYSITNRQLMPFGGSSIQAYNELLGEYDIKVKKPTTKNFSYQNLVTEDYSNISEARGKYEGNHMKYGDHLAGITVQQPDGKRYVYALPAYNKTQVQETFSVPAEADVYNNISFAVDGASPKYKHSSITNEYHERVEIPKYAHSYLLTSVLGDDYVDADNQPGPSDGDYGYWVKFNYVKTSDAFPWRTPLAGASYMPGQRGSSVDDIATYTYGTKEIWYLASAETQTHIVIFEIDTREDGLGPDSELNPLVSNAPSLNTTNRLYKLNAIKLYSKAELATDPNSLPIQTVHFSYSYKLCKATGNSMGTGKAKLTLDRVYFTYKNDRSGMLSPYVFEYDENNNPNYDMFNNKNDRWGTYRSLDYGAGIVNQEFPYTPQFDRTQLQNKANKASFKEMTDKNASAWHLTAVKLPSGGKIKIEYESDDYAYVQHKKAAQMFQVESVGQEPGNTDSNILFKDSDDFWGGQYDGSNNSDVQNSEAARRVYFQLETPIPTSLSEEDVKRKIVEDYFDCLLDKQKNEYIKPLYAKLKVNLRGNIDEYIAGYYRAKIDHSTKKPKCGVGETTVTVDGISCYKYGYVVLDFAVVNDKPVFYHPFAVAAWQHMRINLPRVLTASGNFEDGPPSNTEAMTRIGSLASWANTIRTMFSGYRKYCFEKEFADDIDLSQSFIRLNTPDGVKFGGGSRVKKIYVEDDPIWGNDKIGQVYDYTMAASSRSELRISSGVASYEPIVGGEENVLRSAKITTQSIPFFTDNNLFFETPVNESYYPAPRVGYSQVTVTSLSTSNVQKMIADGANPNDYQGIQMTGKTVNEFYTARDFPTIAEETNLDPYANPYVIPLPFVGMIQISKLTATQGYSIQLNDMHGKPKKVSTFASKTNGGYTENPITSVTYYYKSKPYTYEGESVNKLDNEVDVLVDDAQMVASSYSASGGYDKANVKKMYIGLEYDFFADFRQSTDEAGTGGLDFNMDIMGAGAIGFPLPFPWPSFNFSHTSTRLAVTNKIIHRAGILERTVATDGQSTVSTQNLVYDKYTGEPLLTTVNNNYDNQIYNYAYPAHLAYENMGPSYENVLFEFTGRIAPFTNLQDGWTLEKENLTATPIYLPTGSNVGMGNGFDNVATLNNKIAYADLYKYLNEGDEFIVEFYNFDASKSHYNPAGKQFAILKEKRLGVSYLGCSEEKLLTFDFPYIKSGTFRKGQPVRMLLVRSGKRNLLNTKAGAIKTLMDISAGTDILQNSPLYKRELAYNAGTAQANLYSSLKEELAAFLKSIIDCNGQLTLGQYFMDDARFLKNDGSLKYKNLFNLVYAIRVDDICGGKQNCYKSTTEETGESHEAFWSITCKPECTEIIGGDLYSPIYKCKSGLPEANAASLLGKQIGNCGPTDYTCIENAFNNKYSCFYLKHVDAGPEYRQVCTQGECLDCHESLGTGTDNKPIRKGYHLVLKFKEPFASSIPGGPCITTHCVATAKYKVGTQIRRTKISDITVESGNKLRFHYSDNEVAYTDFCMDEYSFTVPSTYYSIKNVLAASAVEYTPYKINEDLYQKICLQPNNVTATQAPSDLYVLGYKGIWRPSKTYYYSDERFQGQKAGSSDNMTSMLNLPADGVFDGTDNDKKFFLFNWNPYLAKKIHEKWLANETVTAFNMNSQSTEARDVLGIYSCVQFDKNNKQPVAIGKNMKLTQMVYENFDNTETIAWTANDDFDANSVYDINQVQIIKAPFTGNGALSVKTPTRYTFSRNQFKPDSGEYVISLWAGGYNTIYSPAEVDARFGHLMNVKLFFYKKDGTLLHPLANSNITYLQFRPTGKIYEGGGTFWRKLENTFTIPNDAYQMAIEFGTTGFSNNGGQLYGTMYQMVGNGQIFIDQRACYDDIRIFPAKGLMNTYVYNPENYRLLAEGDENNFPTLYGYAPSGSLSIVKKLTEEGLKTLKEIHANTKRNLPGNTPGSGNNE